MNQLKVNRQLSILSLFEQGWSKRRIARELGVDRATIRKYLADASAKSPTPQTGSSTKSGPASLCDPLSEKIQMAWQSGLSIQRVLAARVRNVVASSR